MKTVSVLPARSLGIHFIPDEYLPEGCDQYYQRNRQSVWPQDKWRQLRSDELETLVKNHNTSPNWDDILVTDLFDPRQIRNTEFFGLVRIGRVQDAVLEHHDLRLAVGITNSLIISCDIGDDVAIHNVRYLSHYIVGDRCILFNINEMNTTDHAKFGNGILKEGEPESVRVWIDLMNETGSRQVLPFNGMITADAYLWARYRDDGALMDKLKNITQRSIDPRRGYYGTLGTSSVIKNSQIVKDVTIGSNCYIKGANKIKNVTINSSTDEPTQIGEGVELVNGIVGFGCRIFYGCKAVRFIMGNNSNLKYGARLINSFLGDNSTISCCEVLNNLIFPAHEQHHNNSFLVAAIVMGQSNIAAGATIGSNHNSRANDNEIRAGRGFWPGLCTSLKHSSRFASFVLLSKSDYPAELDIRLPFSLVNNNVSANQLEVMPAYWWMYNMYALARNTWKYQVRDKRLRKVQHIEYQALAPDTVEEILIARRLLRKWTAKAWLNASGTGGDKSDAELDHLGHELLSGDDSKLAGLKVFGERMENSSRKALILKPYAAYRAYHEMLIDYAVKNLIGYLDKNPGSGFTDMVNALEGQRLESWENLGGQLVPKKDVDELRADIGSGSLNTWEEIHCRYEQLWERYPLDKQQHACAILCELLGTKRLTEEQWHQAMHKSIQVQEYISDQVYQTRKKDYDNPFRKITYDSDAELKAALGTVEENEFIIQVRKETEEYKEKLRAIMERK
jgi:hypothetical protein